MIKLNRPDKPDILTKNEHTWLSALRTAISIYGNYYSIPKIEKAKLLAPYRHEEIKKALFESSSEKCAFCESIPAESGFIEVEHFKPKSLYSDFTFDWNNLLPCCRHCNGNKLDHDTVKEPILNPYDIDPEDAFYYREIRIEPKDGLNQSIAEKTIEICGLNGARLMKPRANILVNLYEFSDALKLAIDNYEQADTVAKKKSRIRNINQALEQIELLTENNEKYSAFCKSFLASCKNYIDAKRIVYDFYNAI